jgi:hypothetical protein
MIEETLKKHKLWVEGIHFFITRKEAEEYML